MRKVLKTALVAILALVMLTTVCFAEFVPYPSYTLDTSLKDVPAAPGYLPEEVIGGKMGGNISFKGPEDLYLYENMLIVCDTGNNRVVALNIENDYEVMYTIDIFNGEDTFGSPYGLCVANEELYVADKDNGRLVVFNVNDGSYVREVGAPDLSLSAMQDVKYQPIKVGVDGNGRIFVVSSGATDGLIQIEQDGTFIRYFGSNSVTPNLWELFLRRFMTAEQIKKRVVTIPIEYNNISVDSSDFVYVTTDNVSKLQIKRLNASGGNIMATNGRTEGVYGPPNMGKTHMADVTADAYNNVYGITQDGVIYQYNELGDVLNIFGGFGTTVGTFSSPKAIHVTEDGKTLYVLDATKASVTVFKATEFGELVLKANNTFVEGRYEDSLELWADVLKLNGNYDVAYTGIGNAYMQIQEYELAMKNFQLGENKKDYSKAFEEYRSKLLSDNFSWLMTGALVLVVVLILVRKPIGKIFQKIKHFVNA